VTVPGSVPEKVPAKKRGGRKAAGSRPPPHTTGDPSGWRFQRLQAGHELGDEHDKYGFRALSAEECLRLANLPLQEGIDWTVFKGLDFEAMAKRRRTRGRRPKPMED
jgi:hypothetical protein